MNWRATWILALCAGALLVWIFLDTTQFGSSGNHSGGYVLHFDNEEIQQVDIERGGEKIEFQRTPAGWEMGPFPTDRASDFEMERMLSLAQNLRIIDVIREAEFDRSFRSSAFGLSTPKQKLILHTAREKVELLFGREGAGPTEVFARSGNSKDTFLVSDDLQKLLLQPADHFRDRRLVALPSHLIERVLIRKPDGTIGLSRSGEGWEITSPLQARAATKQVEQKIEEMLGAAISEFLENGFDEGSALQESNEVSLWIEGEEEPVRLRLGKPIKGNVRVFHSGRNALMQVPEENFSLVWADLPDLRDRSLLSINLDWVDRFSLIRAHEKLEFGRTKVGWSTTTDGESGFFAESEVRTLLQNLANLQIDEFRTGGDLTNPKNQPPREEWIVEFDSWLSENTPESSAGRHPITSVRFTQSSNGKWLANIRDQPEIAVLSDSSAEVLNNIFATFFRDSLPEPPQE